MDRLEKTEFILEQVRLCLDKKDFIRAQILSNKISKKAINEKEFQVKLFWTSCFNFVIYKMFFLGFEITIFPINDSILFTSQSIFWYL